MSRGMRWFLAAVVTTLAFVMPTLVCGVWILVPVLPDGGTRWGVASGLGVALAALAALWGHGFATGDTQKSEERSSLPNAGVRALGGRAVAVGGSVRGGVITGDGVPAPGSTGPAAVRRRDESCARVPEPGGVIASGERSVAIGGDAEGDVTTGDGPGVERP